MKVRTVIENKLPKRKIKERKNKIIIALLVLVQTFFNQILPFTLGVYFGLTGSAWLFALFIFMIFFEMRISFDNKNGIQIKIIKGV